MQCLVLFLLLILPPALSAQASSLEDIQRRGSLRVGMSGDYQPFSLCEKAQDQKLGHDHDHDHDQDRDQEPCQGLDVDIAQRLAADLGVRLKIVRFRWPALMADLVADKFDLAMSGITIRPERALMATFTRPYLIAGAVVLVTDTQRFPNLETVNQPGVRLVVNAGGHLEKVARVRFPAVSLLTTQHNMTLPDLLGQRKADALLTDSLEAPHFLAAHPQLHALPPIGRDRKAYVLRREDHELHEWVETWLIKREADGFLKDTRTRWLGKEVGQTPLPPMATVLALMDVRLAIMPAVAAYKRDHQLPIEDLQQEAQVLKKIAALATQNGLDSAVLQTLFRILIDMAKQVQHGVLEDKLVTPTWAQGRDLRQELRPTLSQLSKRIVQEIARLAPSLAPSMRQNRDQMMLAVQQEITPASITAAAKRQLAEALWHVIKHHRTKEREGL